MAVACVAAKADAFVPAVCSERWQFLKVAAGKQDANMDLPVAVEPAGGGSGERVQQALPASQPGDLGVDVGAD